MAIPSFVEAIDVLSSPSDTAAQIHALRHLKSEVIGHEERKESLVRHGVVDAIAQILANLAKSRGKQKSQESNGLTNGHGRSAAWAEDDELKLQAILLLASLAHVGPQFVAPIVAGGLVPQLVAVLSPTTNSPKVVLAALRTLHSLAATSRTTSPAAESFIESPASDALYSKNSVQDFAELLAQKSHSSIVQVQLTTLYQLISLTCTSDHQRGILLSGGVLDLLAARLAAYRANEPSGPSRSTLPAASLLPPTRRTLPHLLGAIVAIVEHSKYRAARLLYSPALIGFFPFRLSNGGFEPLPPQSSSTSQHSLRAFDISLPHIQPPAQKSDSGFSKAFPPLGSARSAVRTQSSMMDLAADSPQAKLVYSPTDESTLIPWLFSTIRSHNPLVRVQAAHLLAALCRLDLLDSSRERSVILLVVPLLTSIHDNRPYVEFDAEAKEDMSDFQAARELSRFVLAKLIQPSRPLQVTVYNSLSTRQEICQSLKASFEPLLMPQPTWAPDRYRSEPDSGDLSPSRTLGLPSLPAALASAYKEREGALLLLAAIADKEDAHRKFFTEKGMTQCIIDSMKPFKQSALVASEGEESVSRKGKINVSEIGNPDNVLIAACVAARALSRSISLLRTSLIDAGLATPTFALLRHPNVEVLKSATDVVCNLDVEFSPMRQDLVEAGAIKTLCEHAHSADSDIRLVSLWALKHLVHQSPSDIKTSCFEELGPGWLIQIVTGGSGASNGRDGKSVSAISMGTANAAGERVDILNAADEPMDNSDDRRGSDSAITGLPSTGEDIAINLLFPRRDPDNVARFVSHANAAKIREFKELDESSVAQEALTNELAIQQQGLDFIRNFLVAPGAVEMVDCLFQTLGASCVFDIVAGKLKSPPLGGLPIEPSILQSSVLILTHVAAGAPRHRQQLISQPALLQSVLPLMTHREPLIRVAAVWMVNNLTWTDDQSDVASARQRAAELKRLGFEEKLKAMREDENIDVKERVNTAIEQLSRLLEGSSTGGGNGSSNGRTSTR